MLFSVALAGLMLGSCSSSDDLNGSGTSENKNGNGYVAFTINLPSQSNMGGRANDDFKDGLKSEYAVKDATILLFSGTNEASATFVAAYKLGTEPWTAPAGDGNNVTTTSKKVVQKLTKSITNAKALVVLNNNGVFTIDETNDGLKINDTAFSGTYSDFLKKAEATSGKTLTSNGFYMANAPLCDKVGDTTDPTTDAKVTTLTDLTGKIYDTEADAKAGEAAQVYVERAVAKVTLDKGTITEADNGAATKVPLEIIGWAIDNTNPTTYLVRSTDGFDTWKRYATNDNSVTRKYRFVGGTAVATGLYRTYFAEDMNFDTDATGLKRAADSDFKSDFGADNPQYCFENTFDVAHQNENQTTLATIKAKLGSGDDFYIVGGDQTTLYTKDNLDKLVKNKFMSTEEAWLKANKKDGETIREPDIALTYDKDAAGVIALTNVEVAASKLKDSPAALPADYLNTVSAAVGSMVCYKGGVSYYTVRIKHFGNELTPWKKGELGVESGTIYPNTDGKQAENWLGRYGVLRNNWYDIQVTGVKGLGSATVPELTGTTDDELDSYIAVQINVLSWAKRTQTTVLH